MLLKVPLALDFPPHTWVHCCLAELLSKLQFGVTKCARWGWVPTPHPNLRKISGDDRCTYVHLSQICKSRLLVCSDWIHTMHVGGSLIMSAGKWMIFLWCVSLDQIPNELSRFAAASSQMVRNWIALHHKSEHARLLHTKKSIFRRRGQLSFAVSWECQE